MSASDATPLLPVKRRWPEFARVALDASDFQLLRRRLSDLGEIAGYDDDALLDQGGRDVSVEPLDEFAKPVFRALCLALVRQVRLEQVIRGRRLTVGDLPLSRIVDALHVSESALDLPSTAGWATARGIDRWLTDAGIPFDRHRRAVDVSELAELLVGRVIEHAAADGPALAQDAGIRLVLDDGTVVAARGSGAERLVVRHRTTGVRGADLDALDALDELAWAEADLSHDRVDGAHVLRVRVDGPSRSPLTVLVACESAGGGLVELRVDAYDGLSAQALTLSASGPGVRTGRAARGD